MRFALEIGDEARARIENCILGPEGTSRGARIEGAVFRIALICEKQRP
jgi:hypothetical protein